MQTTLFRALQSYSSCLHIPLCLSDPSWCGQTGCLGHGTFGIVIKALDLRSDPPTEVAIKLLPRGDFVSSLSLSLAPCMHILHIAQETLTLTEIQQRLHLGEH
jgi:hypothetical protein